MKSNIWSFSSVKLIRFVVVNIFLSFSICCFADRHVTLYTANCSATPNTISFDVYVVNDGDAMINWGGSALLFNVSSSIFNSSDDSCTLSYESGTSDFPLQYDSVSEDHWGHSETYISSSRILYMYTSMGDYSWTGSTVKNMPIDSAFRIGRFILTNNTQNFKAYASAGLTWVTIYSDGIKRTHVFCYDSASRWLYNYEPYSSPDICTLTTPCSITIPACTAPSLSASITNTSCNTSADGAIDLTTDGGTSPFTYAWTKTGDGSFTASTEGISGLGTGTYNVTVTTTTGSCTAAGSYTVTASSSLDTITTTASGCGSYTWSVNKAAYTASGNYTTVIGCQPYKLMLTIYSSKPEKPSTISGTKFNLCGVSDEQAYSVTAASDAASYKWTAVSGGTSISSGNGTNSISLNIPPDFIKGKIKVTALNSCGRSKPVRALLQTRPAQPVISGQSCVSASAADLTYTVTNAVDGVTYTWSVPGTARVTSGQGTSTVTINWRAYSGVIMCTSSNSCASGARSSYTVTVGCGAAALAETVKDMQVKVYPNPSSGLVNLLFTSSKKTKYKLVLTDLAGHSLITKELIASAGKNTVNLDISKYAAGMYMLNLISDEGTQTVKIIKGH